MRTAARFFHGRVKKLGHRGAFLLFLALLDGVFCYGLVAPQPGVVIQQYPFVPVQIWAGAWGFVGLACFLGAWSAKDRWAFALAAFIKTAWALRYVALWQQGVLQAWLAVVVWISFAATVLIIASWPEPIQPINGNGHNMPGAHQ